MAAKFACPSFPRSFSFTSSEYQSSWMRPTSFIQVKCFPLLQQEKKLRRREIKAATTYKQSARRRHGSVNGFSSRKGLGIVDFLKGKNILITGATGFLAKVVIEKILRTQPDVGKLFLVIKAKDPESALCRLDEEVIHTELFNCIQDIYGKTYNTFMVEKLVPVVGDVSLDNLGMQEDVIEKLARQVDIILHSAANTTFDERYDVSLETNTKGTARLMDFAKRCNRLQLFLHISTAYVNGQREGIVVEKPFRMGDSIAKELRGEEAPPLNILEEFELVNTALGYPPTRITNFTSQKDLHADSITQKMKDLGLQRATMHGWQDVYVFSKAMGEMLIEQNRGHIPVAIVRPSIIESSYTDPFPGWIEGLRMMDPLIAYYGKGQLPGLVGDPNVPSDIVPVDMVANAILGAMAKHAGKAGVEVYHVTSSLANPITVRDVVALVHEHFKSRPYFDVQGKAIEVNKSLKYFTNMEDLTSHIVRNTLLSIPSDMGNGSNSVERRKRKQVTMKKIVQRISHVADIYKSYLLREVKYDNWNTERLFEEMSEEEKKMFGFDVKSINWNDYIIDIHIPGLRRHVMKRGGSNMQSLKENGALSIE